MVGLIYGNTMKEQVFCHIKTYPSLYLGYLIVFEDVHELLGRIKLVHLQIGQGRDKSRGYYGSIVTVS